MAMNLTRILIELLVILFALCWIYYSYIFMRNPKRNAPQGNVIVSPANGKISKIVKVGGKNITIEKGLLGKIKTQTKDVGKDATLINIVMNPLNVHFQRSPCDATVLSVTHTPGKFLNAVSGASNLQAALENEHTEILLQTKYGKMKILQIAGFLCRRIETFVQKGHKLKKGETIGVIKLGSQVTLILPAQLHIQVKEDQGVVDGETILATP